MRASYKAEVPFLIGGIITISLFAYVGDKWKKDPNNLKKYPEYYNLTKNENE